jgi:hypothetical protein
MTIAQPPLPTRSSRLFDRCYNSSPRQQPFVLNGLRTLFLPCGSFSYSNRLFSIACVLVDKITGGSIPGLFSFSFVSVSSVSLWQTGAVFAFQPSTADYKLSRAPKAQKWRFVSPLPATLTHSPSRNPFACRSYANTRDMGLSHPKSSSLPQSALCERRALTTFRINTCEPISKQITLTSFRIDTCEKPGRGGSFMLCAARAPYPGGTR